MNRITFAATLVASVAILHLVGQHLWLGESPVWFNTIFAIWGKLLDRAVPQWAIGLVLAAMTLIIARTIWQHGSRFAACLFFGIALWEGYWRLRQARFVLDEGFTFGLSMITGCIAAAFALIVALFAIYATIFRRRR